MTYCALAADAKQFVFQFNLVIRRGQSLPGSSRGSTLPAPRRQQHTWRKASAVWPWQATKVELSRISVFSRFQAVKDHTIQIPNTPPQCCLKVPDVQSDFSTACRLQRQQEYKNTTNRTSTIRFARNMMISGYRIKRQRYVRKATALQRLKDERGCFSASN